MTRIQIAAFIALSLVLTQTPKVRARAKSPLPPASTQPAATDEETEPNTKPELALEPELEPAPLPTPPPLNSGDLRVRSQYTASYTGSILGLAVPFKHGPSLGWIVDRNWTIEASYFSGHLGFGTGFLSVGAFRENLIAVQARYYPRNSFNWIFGLSRQSYDAKLGSDLIRNLSGGSIPSDVDVVKVATVGLQLGFGNRWQWENGFSLGVDWLVLNFPFQTLKSDAPFLSYVNNQDDRAKVEDVLRIMRYIPTGAIAKIALGYSF